MKKHIAPFLKSILAGAAISLGGMIYMSSENKVVGAVMFAVGLLTVVFFGLYLYTGKIGYVMEQTNAQRIDTFVSIVGNLIGALVFGLMHAPIGNVVTACENKLAKDPLAVLVDGILCGVLIFIAVEIYRKHKNIVGILFCVPVFILCGFEHSIADMFYIFNARIFTPEAAWFLTLVVVGNGIGGLIFPVILRLCEKFETKE